uniref:Caspase family p20 domain-containing protein n=2 Tax=Capitella teleta TaxID=283909 RepID=X1ZZK6_CAPTE
MKEAIANFARDEKSVNASSLVVVILTHGDAESFFGVDGCRVDCKTDVVEIFNPDAAPDLQGKPKLFLFQACREKPEDSTREASAPRSESTDEQWDTEPSNVPRYNMLIVNATLPGSKAWKEASRGSLMIDGFCQIVRKKAYEEHVLDMITKLHLELDPPIEHPETVHLLSCKWYLFPLQMFCKRLQHELRTHYDDKLKFIYTMPWLPTEGFSLKETFVQRRLRLTSGDRKGTEVKMDEILASVGEGRNKRILVEGDPAQGKSTLCQALAFAWSQPDEASENIKSFDLVILLHAGDLRGQDSVGGAIKEHLLPIDCGIHSRQLEELLQEKNVLLIIDAFDEASTENEMLHQLIEGKRLKHKILLITSRPNFLENKQRHFESTFTVEGYDEEERLEHVKQYAAAQETSPQQPFISMLEEESIRDLCSNPLNLTLLCLLREEDTQLRNTRTALY